MFHFHSQDPNTTQSYGRSEHCPTNWCVNTASSSTPLKKIFIQTHTQKAIPVREKWLPSFDNRILSSGTCLKHVHHRTVRTADTQFMTPLIATASTAALAHKTQQICFLFLSFSLSVFFFLFFFPRRFAALSRS